MQIIADVSKMLETVQRNLTFILNVPSETSITLPSFQLFLLKGMLVFSHKIVFIENETALLGVTMRERARGFPGTI